MLGHWLTWALLAILTWGVWGVFAKQASGLLSWQQVTLFSFFGTAAVFALMYTYYRPGLPVEGLGFKLALIGGLSSGVAVLAFYVALQLGKASLVVPTAALYPLVTTILSFIILHERVSWSQGLGIALAIAAIVLMSRG